MIKTHLYFQWTNYLQKSLSSIRVLTEDIDYESIRTHYFEYYLQTLNIQEYEVFVSKELKQNKDYEKYQIIIEEVIQKSQNVKDLNAYLSKGIKKIITSDKMLIDSACLDENIIPLSIAVI